MEASGNMEREIKVALIPVEHDPLIKNFDFTKIVEAQMGEKTDSGEVSKKMKAALNDHVVIRLSVFNDLPEDQWNELRRKVETHLQKFALSLRTAMQLSLRGDEYPLKIIAEAVRVIEEDVAFRAILELGKSKK